MGIQFNLKINNVMFDVHFSDQLNFIKGSFGVGKSFLLNTIQSYCIFEGISCALINSTVLASANTDIIYSMCQNKDIVLLDDTDLYLDNELFCKIKNLNCTVIFNKKSVFGLDMAGVHLYIVRYEGDKLYTERWQ